MKRPTTCRDVRPQLDENGLRQLAKEMLEKGQDALRIRKSKLGVKNLDFLAEFRHIRYLAIEEISSGIQAVKHLDELRYLFLNRHKNLNLKFLNHVSSSIETLYICWSRCKEAAAIAVLKGLRSLTIDNVHGLESFEFLAQLKRLEYAQLQKLDDITSFPSLDTATSLRFFSLTSAPGLTDIRGLAMAPQLETVIIQDTPRLPPDNLAKFLSHPELKFIYPCLDFDGDAAVNKQAEEVLSPRFGTELLDAEIPEFSFR
jgi:hypothetical protein